MLLSVSRASYEHFSAYTTHAGPSTRRHLSNTALRNAAPVGHYEALSLPRNATRQQVKARFYELSKKYHPDAPGGNTSKFHEINDAYATLGDEKKRRQYDITTSQPSGGQSSPFGTYSTHRPHRTGPNQYWGRGPSSPRKPHPSASQAHYSPFGRRTPPGYGETTGGGPYARVTPDPFGRTTSSARKKSTDQSDMESQGEGVLWRFVVVVGLLLAVVGFGGGLTASAEEVSLAEVVKQRGRQQSEISQATGSAMVEEGAADQ